MAAAEPKELGTLIVVVSRAKNLPNKSRFGKQDPFCTVALNDKKLKTRAIKRGGQHPEWDEELRFTIYEDADDMLASSEAAGSMAGKNSLPKLPDEPGVVTPQSMANKARQKAKAAGNKGGKSIKVTCWADDLKDPEFIGEVVINIDEVLKHGELDDWYELNSNNAKERYTGEVLLELTFYSNAPPPVKRNAPKPQPYNMPPVRPGMTSSTSTAKLYTPPYAQPGAPANGAAPVPPSQQGVPSQPLAVPGGGTVNQQNHPLRQSASWNDFGLPQKQQGHGSVPGQPEFPPGQSPNHAQVIDSLTRPMAAMSMGPSYRPHAPPIQQPPQAQSLSNHHHRHSLNAPGTGPAPWAGLQQPPAVPSPTQRPVSADAPWANSSQASTMPPRPLSSVGSLPNQQMGGPPAHHKQQASLGLPAGGYPGRPGSAEPPRTASPQPYYPSTTPQPPAAPHAQQQQAPYTPPHGQYQQQQPPQQPYGGPPPQQQQPYVPQPSQQQQYGQQPPPQQQQAYPAVPPPAPQFANGQYPGQAPPPVQPPPSVPPSGHGRTSSWSQGPPPQPPVIPPPQQQQPANGQYGLHPQQQQQNQQYPPAPDHHHQQQQQQPATTTGAYVPWYMQTQSNNNSPAQSGQYGTPPPVPPAPYGQQPPPPAPPRHSGVGYYPSDELYAKQQQQQQPTPAQQPQQPPHPPSPNNPYGGYPNQQQQPPQQQQQFPPQAYSPNHVNTVQPPPPVQGQPYSPSRNQSYPPYSAPGSAPQQPPPPSSEAPWAPLQQQQQQQQQGYNAPPQPTPTPSQTSIYAQQNTDFRPGTAAPDGWHSTVPNSNQLGSNIGTIAGPHSSAPPRPMPPQSGGSNNTDWRSYLGSIGSSPSTGGGPPPPPMRATSPIPPPRPYADNGSAQSTPSRPPVGGYQQQQQDWYTPPPAVPASIMPDYRPPNQPQWH